MLKVIISRHVGGDICIVIFCIIGLVYTVVELFVLNE